MESYKPIRQKRGGLEAIAWVFVVLGLLAAGYGYRTLVGTEGKFDLSNLANYGSYLSGAVSSLWSLAALFFIYETLVAQKRQLQQQEVELENQRKDSQLQQESLNHQNFETAFFHLLNLQNSIASQLDVTLGGTRYKGRACFEPLYKLLSDDFHIGLSVRNLVEPPQAFGEKREFAVEVYCEFYGKQQAALGHYFRNLYHIIKFVKGSGYEYSQQRRYTSLARAQLSAYELGLLFYNGLTPLGEKFKPLIEEFGLLENFEKTILPDKEHALLYESAAYH